MADNHALPKLAVGSSLRQPAKQSPTHKMPLAAAPHIIRADSAESSSSDSDPVTRTTKGGDSDDDDAEAEQFQFTPAVVMTPMDEIPMPNFSSSVPYGWQNPLRERGNSATLDISSSPSAAAAAAGAAAAGVAPGMHHAASTTRLPTRPGPPRTMSNAYAPSMARRPTSHSYNNTRDKHRNSSGNRTRRNNPNADYRAQEKAYVQRIRQDAPDPDEFINNDLRTPSLGHTSSDDSDEESPSTADLLDDQFDQDTFPLYGNEDMQPSVEELKIPENRERLEWHSMLANVLTGDVVKQEKKRLIGGGDLQSDDAQKAEIWMGIRARCCGRILQAQRRMVEEARGSVNHDIDMICNFAIKGEAEVGKSAIEQVNEVISKIDKMDSLYPTRAALQVAHPRAKSDQFNDTCEAVIAWYNTMQIISTQVGTLQRWVGNEELDFLKPKDRDENDHNSHLADESSFVDRILKEDSFKSLQGKDNLMDPLNVVINKAKATLIANAKAFADRHLPLYIEELQTLINFPSRLVQEIIRVRIAYARKVKDLASQGVLMTEQMISQFRMLLTLSVRIKETYNVIAEPEPGWDPPECLEENFDLVVLDALKFYFKLLNWKLSANKNAFKEAEILEEQWDFCNQLGRHLEGGDVEVAEQFSSLTAKSLLRLSTQFEKELQKRPDEVAGADMDRRYKAILDSVRIRQRKLFRFSKVLTQRFENCAEYNVGLQHNKLMEFYDALVYSGHFLIQPEKAQATGIYFIASPSLQDRPRDIQSLLGTCYHAEENPEDPSNPYVLILRPETPLYWAGQVMDFPIREPFLDVQTSRLRIVADGSQQRLANAKIEFAAAVGIELTVLNEQRANLPRVNQELKKIKKTAFRLSNTIMDSVQIIRKQTAGLDCQELIQTCFAFATEFGQRSVMYMDIQRRFQNHVRLMRLALDWISFICDDCDPADRKTFRWAVVALEFAMMMTRGQNLLAMNDSEYAMLRTKVAGCMSLLISHFDIMGARSTMAAQQEKQRAELMFGKHRLDINALKDDEESAKAVRAQWLEQLTEIDDFRKQKEAERQALGRVLEASNEADRALTYLSASVTNVQMRWQQGQFVGGGTFGSVYVGINLDSGQLMAVKEIRLQDPQLIPTIVGQIRDEMNVLQVLDHPHVVQYYGIEPHRDKVYIFMEYCDGGSLAALLEHGRIEDETILLIYAFQMLQGLAYLHERGIVHRDIKPDNILLDHEGLIKFVDFGAAKIIAKQGRTLAAPAKATVQDFNIGKAAAKQGHGNNAGAGGGRQNSIQGTPMYMSPEVIRGSNLGRLGAVDIWSLGCVIAEMATGRRPWANLDNEWAIMYNIAQGNPPQLPTKDQLSDQGIEFLQRCFESDPNKRASAAELLQSDWIMVVRNQLSFDQNVQTPATPASEASFSGSSVGGHMPGLSHQSTATSWSSGDMISEEKGE